MEQMKISFKEFVVLVALLMSLTALSIDTMLPALSLMVDDLSVQNPNDIQLVISSVFLGIALGMPFYGPLSDSIGRKKALYLGLGVFIVGCIVSLQAQSLSMMLLGRLLQGFGAASPRVVNMALVRDKFSGSQMAQVVSFSMTLFIFIPAIAPLLGQGILLFFDWHAIFVSFIIFSVIILVWFGFRMEETLTVENQREFRLKPILNGSKEVLSDKTVSIYTIIISLILGSFIGFLSSVQQVLQEMYLVGNQFPLYFAMMALSLGVASFINGKIVLKYGAKSLAQKAMKFKIFLSFICLLILPFYEGVPSFSIAMIYFMFTFFSVGMLFGNLNSLAMEPIGHIAGLGSALIGAISTLLSLPIGVFIGQMYDKTIYPLVFGFFIVAVLSLLLLKRVQK